MPLIDLNTVRWEAQVYTVTDRQLHDGEAVPLILIREHADRGLKLAAAVPDLLDEIDVLQARISELERRRPAPKGAQGV